MYICTMDEVAAMKRCIALAQNSIGYHHPNPKVGCIIVHNNKIIGEGFHHKYGYEHAEVMAMRSVKPEYLEFIQKSTLFVNLEPCSHYGKTPPCADMIIKSGIKNVVIGTKDPNPIVSGKGIEKLRLSGIDVSVGIAEDECLKLNRRFFKSIKTGNPYIILKWAESSDHFVDINRDSNKINPIQISSIPSRSLLHSWRAKEEAILIGMKTFILDEPLLNVRYSKGPDPKKILWLSDNRASSKNIFDNAIKNGWIVWTINKNEDQVDALRRNLNKCQFRSILVEGGTDTINLFLNNNLWDECRIIKNEKIYLEDGVKAPISPENWSTSKSYTVEDDRISIFKKL